MSSFAACKTFGFLIKLASAAKSIPTSITIRTLKTNTNLVRMYMDRIYQDAYEYRIDYAFHVTTRLCFNGNIVLSSWLQILLHHSTSLAHSIVNSQMAGFI